MATTRCPPYDSIRRTDKNIRETRPGRIFTRSTSKYNNNNRSRNPILEGHDLATLKNLLYFSRPNYFQLIYQQEPSVVNEAFEKVKWELPSYPQAYHPYFYNFIASYHAIKRSPGKSEEYFLEAIRVKPSSEITLTNYILLLCESGNREKTAIYFKRLNEIKRGLPEVKLDLAILFQLFNLNVAARVLLEEYVKTTAHVNDFVMFLFGKVILNHAIGKAMYDTNIERAIKIFNSVNKRSPFFLPNCDLLMKSLNKKWKSSQKKSGKEPHPYSVFLAERTRLPDRSKHSHALYLQAVIRMRVGEVEEAKKALIQSVELADNPENHYRLGKCHLALSELQEAGAHFREARIRSSKPRVKFVLLEATALVEQGRKAEGLRLINKALENTSLSKHEKRELSLFSAEHNIAAYPEVSSTLDKTLALLHKSFSKRLYSKMVKVVKMFTEHLSQYYCTTGLPAAQIETLTRWTGFLRERGEITEERFNEMTRVRETLGIKQSHHGRRISTTSSRPPMRRRSSVLSPALRVSPDQQSCAGGARENSAKLLHLVSTGLRMRRKSVVQAPASMLGSADHCSTPRSSFYMSLDSSEMAEEN